MPPSGGSEGAEVDGVATSGSAAETNQSQSNEPPPDYDGTTDYRTYKKKLKLWTMFTRTPKHFQGPRVLSKLTGRAWQHAEALDIDELCVDGGVDQVLQVLDEKLLPEEETELFDVLEEVFYGEGKKRAEKWGDYVTRVTNAYVRLKKLGIELPGAVKGFLALRKSGLKPEARVAVLSLTGGQLEMDRVTKALKRYADEYLREAAPSGPAVSTRAPVYRAEADPENEECEDPEVLAAADDLDRDFDREIETALEALDSQKEESYEEHDAEEILMAYREARQASRNQRLARGFQKPPPPVAGRTASGKSYRIQGRLSLQELIAKTRCKLCRAKGQWSARTVVGAPLPPEEPTTRRT